VTIDDKHIEIIVAQMMRKVRVDEPGDSDFLPGSLIDKFKFRKSNDQLLKEKKRRPPPSRCCSASPRPHSSPSR
jgi:DNA-directed RNA polymerase subunit beta'